MNTIAINFTDLAGHFWTLDWEPTTNKGKHLSDSDIQAVLQYIKTGSWAMPVSRAAQNCYDNLAAQIARVIDDAACIDSQRANEIVLKIERAYVEKRLSPKGRELYKRCIALCNTMGYTEETTKRVRKLIAKIIKTDNLFAVKLAEDSWLEDVMGDGMKCCLCGTLITDKEGHDPYPVRPESWYGEKKNRCCTKCNHQIVLPARLRFGRHARSCRDGLQKMGYEELLAFVQ